MDPKEFRNALGAFATGVTIVTTRSVDGVDVGVTANSFNSVSLDPPMVLWSLARNSGSFEAFRNASHFTAHILAFDQEALSNTFAKRGIDKFEGLSLMRGHGDAPLLDGCSARFQCKIAYRYEGGDHVILVGEVLGFDHFERKPLAFLGGRYAYTLQKPRGPSQDDFVDTVNGIDRNWLLYLIRRAGQGFDFKIRPVLENHSLEECDHDLLHALFAQSRTIEQLNVLLDPPRGVCISSLAERQIARGMVTHSNGEFHLTDSGRALTITLLASAKSLENDAARGLEPAERLLLKELLWKVIRETDSSVSSPD